MKVLVVGGAGYIGGAVTDELVRRNIPFTVYDDLLYEQHYLKPVDFVSGDVRDYEKLKKILPEYTHVIWLAAIVGDPACKIRPDITKAVNQNSVEWLSKNYDGRIVFMSTCSVYGQNDEEVNEDTPHKPLSLYAETKSNSEKFLKDKNAIIFRLGTVFGVSDTYSRIRMDLAVNYMTANAVKKGTLSVFGGTQWRPFIHVKNIGEIIVNNLNNLATGPYNIAAFNYQIKELGEEIGKITGAKIKYAEQKFQDQRNYHVSNDKAKKDNVLNMSKILTVADGVKEIADLVSSGRIKYTENDVYSNERYLTKLNENGEFN
jgi:nucleoside-diphosphate-sugar epimerase